MNLSMVLTHILTTVVRLSFYCMCYMYQVPIFINNANSILGLGTEVSRALVDSFTHGFVGYLSWAIIIDFSMFGMDMLECSGCMMLAMLVDTDHFIATRSLQMKVRFNCIFSTLCQWKLQAPLKKKTPQRPVQTTIGWLNSQGTMYMEIFKYRYGSELFFPYYHRYITIPVEI